MTNTSMTRHPSRIVLTGIYAFSLLQPLQALPYAFQASPEPVCAAITQLHTNLPPPADYEFVTSNLFPTQDKIEQQPRPLFGGDPVPKWRTEKQLEAELLLQCVLYDACCKGDEKARAEAMERWFRKGSTSDYLNLGGTEKEGCPWGKEHCSANLMYHYGVLKRWEQTEGYKAYRVFAGKQTGYTIRTAT